MGAGIGAQNGLPAVAELLRLLLILVFVTLIVVIIYWLHRYLKPFALQAAARGSPSSVQMDNPREKMALPLDPGGAALELIREGRYREALSLCLRACIAHFSVVLSPPIPDGATESECVNFISGRVAPAAESYFRQLSRVWLRLAYARLDPDLGEITRLANQLNPVLASPQRELSFVTTTAE